MFFFPIRCLSGQLNITSVRAPLGRSSSTYILKNVLKHLLDYHMFWNLCSRTFLGSPWVIDKVITSISMIFYDILNQLLSPVNIILITTRFNIIRHETCQDSFRPNIVDWVNIFNCIKMKRYVWASDEMLVMAMEVK